MKPLMIVYYNIVIVFVIVVNHVDFIIKYKDKTKNGRILLQPFIKFK